MVTCYIHLIVCARAVAPTSTPVLACFWSVSGNRGAFLGLPVLEVLVAFLGLRLGFWMREPVRSGFLSAVGATVKFTLRLRFAIKRFRHRDSLVFDDAGVASLYEQAFEHAFTNEDEFKKSAISMQWYDVKKGGIPQLSVSFAPHSTPFSLDKVARTIDSATSSVFFAVMEMVGKGAVMTALQNLGLRQNLFSLGTIQSEG